MMLPATTLSAGLLMVVVLPGVADASVATPDEGVVVQTVQQRPSPDDDPFCVRYGFTHVFCL